MTEDTMADERHTDLLGLLVIHETGLSTLYRIFSEKFPEHGDFWKDLSGQEKEHAGALRQLKKTAGPKTLAEHEKRLSQDAAQTSLAHLRNEIRQARRITDSIEAFSAAYNFEAATVERKYYEVFAEESKAGRTFGRLAEVTREHVQQIKQAWAAAVERSEGGEEGIASR